MGVLPLCVYVEKVQRSSGTEVVSHWLGAGSQWMLLTKLTPLTPWGKICFMYMSPLPTCVYVHHMCAQ